MTKTSFDLYINENIKSFPKSIEFIELLRVQGNVVHNELHCSNGDYRRNRLPLDSGKHSEKGQGEA